VPDLAGKLLCWLGKGTKLGDNGSGSLSANHERHATKQDREVVWWKNGLGNWESSPLLSRTLLSYFRESRRSI
jgi:hypothetical protein